MKMVLPVRLILLIAVATMIAAAPHARSRLQQAPDGPQPAPSTQPTNGAISAPVAEASPKSEYPISVESSAVNVDVLVTDEDGKVLGGLKRENFRILDNGKPQAITNFAPADAPITIVMLLEYSGLAYDYFAYKGASWASAFLDHVSPEDWVALITYDLKPTIAVDFTHSKAAVWEALSQLSYPQFREANMYDAIGDTLDRLDRIKGKKSILLITTGADTMSATSLEETYRRLRASDVTVFSVGVAENEFLASEPSISYFQAKNELQTFAKLTGGHSWFPRFEGELPAIFESVSNFLRNQYRLGFSPVNLPHDGKYHRLKLEIVDAAGKPLIVTNEKGKRRKVAVYAREGYIDSKKASK